jgi:small-conductance mechanosensitive channel
VIICFFSANPILPVWSLALQDTLSNLFAGFYVSLAGQVRIGDYIKLESSEEGYVTDISLA